MCDASAVFGCENWIMTSAMVEELESFQGELAKRLLKWPKHYSNTAAVITLGFQSVQCIYDFGKEAGFPAESVGL